MLKRGVTQKFICTKHTTCIKSSCNLETFKRKQQTITFLANSSGGTFENNIVTKHIPLGNCVSFLLGQMNFSQ